MPERLAVTDPFKQVTEMVGSGPFRFLADERVSGARVAYARFEGYQPRDTGVADWTAGPKVVHFDRVEWTVIPDGATAAAALQRGEADWWEQPLFDLLPLLARDPGLATPVVEVTGNIGLLRMNALHPPFDNPAIRRALLLALDQSDFMRAVAGDQESVLAERRRLLRAGHADGERSRACGAQWPARRRRGAAGHAGRRLCWGARGADEPRRLSAHRRFGRRRRRPAAALRHERRRAGDGLGQRDPAPSEQGGAGAGGLERVHHHLHRRRHVEPGEQPGAARHRRRTVGSAGRRRRGWRRCGTLGWRRRTLPRANVASRRICRGRRSRMCRSCRWGSFFSRRFGRGG